MASAERDLENGWDAKGVAVNLKFDATSPKTTAKQFETAEAPEARVAPTYQGSYDHPPPMQFDCASAGRMRL